jgi:hypothetical protein
LTRRSGSDSFDIEKRNQIYDKVRDLNREWDVPEASLNEIAINPALNVSGPNPYFILADFLL